VHIDRMLVGTHRLGAAWYQQTGDCVIPKIGGCYQEIGGWEGHRDRRLDGFKRQETVCYAEVGGWLVPRDGLRDTARYAEVYKTGWCPEA